MILVTGSLAFDFIMNFPGRFSDNILPEKIHTLNLSFSVKTLRRERGGCAANIAYNLALLGEKPAILGVLGRDGRRYKNWLKKRGIDVFLIQIIKSKGTASAFIMTDSVDNQITGFYPGPMVENKKLKIENCKLKINLVIIAPNEPKAMINFTKECQKLSLPYLFDPGMQLPKLSKKDLEMGIRRAKIIVGNDYEIGLIMSKLKTQNSKLKLKSQIWITTLGARGSMIEYQGKKIKVKAAKPKTIADPTGAGDAYRAGFIFGYLHGYDLKTAGQIGSVCAVYTVEKYGTTTHRFTKKEFQTRYQENFSEEMKL